MFYGTSTIATLNLTPEQLAVAQEWLRVAGSLNDVSIMFLKQASAVALHSTLTRLERADEATWTGFDTGHINNALAGGESEATEMLKRYTAEQEAA